MQKRVIKKLSLDWTGTASNTLRILKEFLCLTVYDKCVCDKAPEYIKEVVSIFL